MITTAIKRKTGDIGDVIRDYTPASLDENSKMKVDGESVLDRLIKMYQKIEQRYKENKEIDKRILFNDFNDIVVSPLDINQFFKAATSYLAETVLDKNCLNITIGMLIQQSYNDGNNGFILTNNRKELFLNNLHGTKHNPLQIRFESDILDYELEGLHDNGISFEIISNLDIELHQQINQLGYTNMFKTSRVVVYGVNNNECLIVNSNNSLFEFYGDVSNLSLSYNHKNYKCEFIFHGNVSDFEIGDLIEECTFVFYKSVLFKESVYNNNFRYSDNIFKTNNEETLNELLKRLFKTEYDNKRYNKFRHKQPNNEIYFIEPDGTEKLVWYVDEKGEVVRNK